MRRPIPDIYAQLLSEAQRATVRANRAPESFPFFGVPCLQICSVYGDVTSQPQLYAAVPGFVHKVPGSVHMVPGLNSRINSNKNPSEPVPRGRLGFRRLELAELNTVPLVVFSSASPRSPGPLG